jgi:Carboxypeptidase regulatory-like domain
MRREQAFRRRVVWPATLACVLGGVAPCAADASGVLKGTVQDGSGARLSGAFVELTTESPSVGDASVNEKTVTGATGEFAIKGVPAGWFTVTVRAKGWSDVSLRRARMVEGGFVDLLVPMSAGNGQPPVTLDALSHAVAMTPLDDIWQSLEASCQDAATESCLELAGIHLAARRDRLAFGAYERACAEEDGLGCLALVEHARAFGLASAAIAEYRTRASPLLERACARGEGSGCAALAAESKDDARARALWTKACDGGSATGCTRLADAIDDPASKATLMKRARTLADEGCVANRARDCWLAARSRMGDDSPEIDRRYAAIYMRKACALGQLEACVP